MLCRACRQAGMPAALPAHIRHIQGARQTHVRLAAGRPFLVIQEPVLDWTTDANGVSHTANLLAEAGFIKLAGAAPQGAATEATPEGALRRPPPAPLAFALCLRAAGRP